MVVRAQGQPPKPLNGNAAQYYASHPNLGPLPPLHARPQMAQQSPSGSYAQSPAAMSPYGTYQQQQPAVTTRLVPAGAPIPPRYGQAQGQPSPYGQFTSNAPPQQYGQQRAPQLSQQPMSQQHQMQLQQLQQQQRQQQLQQQQMQQQQRSQFTQAPQSQVHPIYPMLPIQELQRFVQGTDLRTVPAERLSALNQTVQINLHSGRTQNAPSQAQAQAAAAQHRLMQQQAMAQRIAHQQQQAAQSYNARPVQNVARTTESKLMAAHKPAKALKRRLDSDSEGGGDYDSADSGEGNAWEEKAMAEREADALKFMNTCTVEQLPDFTGAHHYVELCIMLTFLRSLYSGDGSSCH